MPLSDCQQQTLVRLNGHVCPELLNRAKLALRVYGIPYGDLEAPDSVYRLYRAIERYSQTFVDHDAISLLQFMLLLVGASTDQVNKLGSNEKSLEACRKKSKFAELVYRLCAGLSDDDYTHLKDLACDYIDVAPQVIKSREDLFQKCISQEVLQKDDNEFKQFKKWLGTLGRNDLVAEIDTYISERSRSQEGSPSSRPPPASPVTEPGTSEEERGSPDRLDFPKPKEESQRRSQVDPERQDLVGGVPSNNPPFDVPTLTTDRGVRETLDKDDGSIQRVHEHPPTENATVLANQGVVRDDPLYPIRNTERERLILSPSPSNRDDDVIIRQVSFCRRHVCRFISLTCGISMCIAIGLILVAVFFMVVVYHFRMDSKPQEVELRPGETVECGQLEWFDRSLHLTKNSTADTSSNPYEVELYSASKDDLETLRETKCDNYSEGDFVPSESRFTIPRGTFIHLPYLMSGSNVTVFICLGSNHMTPINAQLYVFNNRFAVENYLNRNTNSTSDAVYSSSLEVGTYGNMLCQTKEYPVTKINSGYYRIALEVASEVTVHVNYSITLNVKYINSSNLTQVKPCHVVDGRTPCSVGFGLSVNTRTALCYVRKTDSSPHTAYLIIKKITRFVPGKTKIAGFVLLSLSLCVVLILGCIIYMIRCYNKRQRCRN